MLKADVTDLESTYTSLEDERNWILISGEERDRDEMVIQYDAMFQEIEERSENKATEIEKLLLKSKVDITTGPCVASLDNALKAFGVEREAYYGRCLVGNACHKILQPDNISLCAAIPNTNNMETEDLLLHEKAVNICSKFKDCCHYTVDVITYLILHTT